MTHARWAAERSGEAPPALVQRLRDIFAAHPEWEALAVARPNNDNRVFGENRGLDIKRSSNK